MKRSVLNFLALPMLLVFLGCAGSPFVQKDIALYNQGVQLVEADKDLQAVECFKQVLEINPKHPLAHYNLGVLYDDNGMFDEAIEQFRLALEINPKNIDAQYRLGIAYATQGMDEQAIVQLQRVLVVEPRHIPSLYNLAVLLEGLGQQDQAIATYRNIIEIKPDHAETLNNLGLAYAKKGMLDIAKEHLEKAIGARPAYFEALNNLGIVLVQKQSYGKASTIFQKALKQNPQAAQTLYNLAKIHVEQIHDYRAAVEYAQRYLALKGRLEKKTEVEGLLLASQQELGNLQKQATMSVEGQIKRDAREFLLAVQRADFREFYVFQPVELRETLTKTQWDHDISQMDPVNLAEQKDALLKLIGFDDVLSVDVQAVELVSPQKAKVVLASRFSKDHSQKESYWEQVNGRWVPSAFLQRIEDNWNRSKIDTIH